MNGFRQLFLFFYRIGYERIAVCIIFRYSAQDMHIRIVNMMRWLDRSAIVCGILEIIHRIAYMDEPQYVSGVVLNSPLILAAGFVKGDGFTHEEEALDAVRVGQNIIPGWRSMPQLVGLVELGSFTRYPRMGNTGTIMWRDETTRSTQNRVGLKNPGVVAAATFLAKHKDALPKQYGINLAVSPGINDPQQSKTEIVESIATFLDKGIVPTWFTLNLSCPNTEDDPNSNQTESLAYELCSGIINVLRDRDIDIPLWVKISPDLSPDQYCILMRVFETVGVGAVIATNTLGLPEPDNPERIAGVGGGRLHQYSVSTVNILMREKETHGYKVDVIGCGGVFDKASYCAYLQNGVQVVQYWSALVFRGPLAAAIIRQEMNDGTKLSE